MESLHQGINLPCSILIGKMVALLLFLLTCLCPATNASPLNACPDCGDLAVPYPLSTNDDCGDSRYKIYCNNGNLEFLSATGTYYKILKIDPRANKLVVRPPLILKDTCYSSDLPMGGFLLDESLPFNISTHNTVMLLNCSDNILFSPLNCSSTSICRQFEEKVEEGKGCLDTLCCHYLKDSAMNSHRIRLRVGGCTAYTCLVDFTPDDPLDSWNYGIELQWLPPNWLGSMHVHAKNLFVWHLLMLPLIWSSCSYTTVCCFPLLEEEITLLSVCSCLQIATCFVLSCVMFLGFAFGLGSLICLFAFFRFLFE